mgnify:FL=1
MITLKPNPFQSVNREEEEEVKCGWCLSEWRVIRRNWWWFIYVCVGLVSFFVYGIVLDVCLFDFDFSGYCVIKLFRKWIATHRLSKCKSPHHDYRGIRFLRWKDNWFWSHRLQWNISCTLWVSWIHRMGWITACIIGTMDCKEWQE